MSKENTVVLYTVEHSGSFRPFYEGLSLVKAEEDYQARINYYIQQRVSVEPVEHPLPAGTIKSCSLDFYGSRSTNFLSIKKRLIGGP